MANKKRILSFVLALVMVLTVVMQLVACGPDSTDTGTGGGTNTDTGSTDTSTGGGNQIVDKVGYTVNVKSIGGMALEGVKVYVADAEGNIKKEGIGTTNHLGSVTLNLPRASGYTISLEDYPEGYIVEDSYDMGTTGATITLTSAPIKGDGAGARYELGDIIHDYKITVDGVTYTFSEILKEKKAIVLNFWFTTCNYCIEEFPDMEASYAKYADTVALFALNGKLGGDSASEVDSFRTSFHYAYNDFTSLRAALVANELTNAIGKGISYEVLSKQKIYEGFDNTLLLILEADDKSAKANEIADAIVEALYKEDDSNLKSSLLAFADELKTADVANEDALGEIFENAKKNIYNSFALNLPMVKDANDIESCFGITGNPVTIVIDRYGMISFMHQGGIPNEKYFDSLFNYYTVRDYQQQLFNGIGELSPTVKPTEEAPSNEEYNAALNAGGADIEFYPETETSDWEYSWPFVITTKDGVTGVKPSNYDQDTSFATLHAKVKLNEGEAIMFDYLTSTQYGYDVMYVLVDGKDIYTISGETEAWKGCCPWVAKEDCEIDLAFVYTKDYADYEGDDAVYLSNFRVVSAEEIDVATYIPRDAATNLNEYGSDYENYVEVFLGSDGYYHVGSETGPILLANLIGYTNFSHDYSITLEISETKEFFIDGVNYYSDLIKYCNYASNSQIYNLCSVTPTLRKYLEAFVDQYIGVGEGNPNQWLTLCSYYDTYGTDGVQLEDPIKGLASFSAYEVKEDSANLVEYNRVIMPRGLLYKFVPTKDGVYRFTTNSDYEVNGWIFIGDHDDWLETGDRILYTDSDVGERFCKELLIDPDGDGTYERDYTNASLVAFMEAGKEYYIDFAYYDQYQYGKFTFDVKYLGETYDHFIAASPGVFTYEEGVGGAMGDTVAGGIDVKLGEDGFYHHLKANGELGSIVYADFSHTTSIFTSQSIKMLCEAGAFNFAITEVDQMAIAYLDKYGLDGLEDAWGDDYENNYKYYQIDDILEEKYHGYYVDGVYKSFGYEYVTDELTGETTMVLQEIPKNAVPAPDYTALIKKYAELVHNSDTEYVERQGCVAVTKELAEALQTLMDKFTFEGVENSWTKLCYYYEYLGQ